MTSLDRLTVASRVFGIAALLGLGLASRDPEVIVSLVVISTVAIAAVYVSLTTPLATAFVVTVEAAITGLMIGLALPGGILFLPYLVVLTLIAGILRGVVGVSAVVVVQFFTIGLVTAIWVRDASRGDLVQVLSPWLLTSIGVGLLGSWLRAAGKIPHTSDRNSAYESAHRLLTQLRAVARRLSSGLDPVTIATHIRDDVIDTLTAARTGVFIRTEGGLLSPIAYSDGTAPEHLPTSAEISDGPWDKTEPTVMAVNDVAGSYVISLPLRVGSRLIGVALAHVRVSPSEDTLKTTMRTLDEHSLRLDTALAFDEIRTIATVEERRRLAREIHDGIAQEVASLGYLVDDLSATAESERQQQGLTLLRQELTRVVSELRLSIFDLRSEVVRETGLGAALSEYVRQVGSRSALTVHLSLDEAPTRLRAETETELLRIAQEAITNARKHSGAKNLWVHCRVRPPFAQLEVRDDGAGLSKGRSDSYGLKIMEERAQRLGAQLEIESSRGRPGTSVRITLGRGPRPATHTESEQVDVATGAEVRLAGGRP
jgi:signal transduction histidine kinase